MKKLLLAGLVVALFAGMASAQLLDQTATVDVQVAVNGIWSLTMSAPLVDFGAMDVGTNATQGVTATVRTNQKVAWYLKLHKSQDLTHTTDATEFIPSANFLYTGSGGAGAWVNGEFQAVATTAYTATAAEQKAAAGIALTTTYDLTIPAEAVAGTYTNTITYTLTATP